ncbi:MAG: NDP-hexose 3-C-methyltransferase [Candidatus Woesebacteria bacterium GW2011_GWB1_41_10]|uniref:NDP-hexose 3-C-methyltransferase n=1 Tax=Candidatus Woesebacteria bacterium GW2011_GWB1_41_10 TaxID=1618577 RepID=A0A0G0UKY4_9BACT|nr:MAG: NDP-hexose 3-C-methyltransferase [Candidatus Woesebacteria bacterium GW2011_GWB1_41_10]
MTKDVNKISSCQFCKNKNIKKVLDFGSTPPANSFLKKSQLKNKEARFPLHVFFCKNCHLLQLGHVVNPEILFKDYVYTSSTSPVFIKHFEDYAKKVFDRFHLNRNSFVIDIGSNDGILLKPFKSLGTKILGVDPAENLATKAIMEGIPTLPKFFDSNLAQEIVDNAGQADIVTANNVFAHIRDLDEITSGVKVLLRDNGVFIFEVAYLGDFIEKNYFDTVYHEHLFYHAISPLDKFFKRHQMTIFDVEKVPTHGGSIRVFVKKISSKYKISDSVQKMIKDEIKRGLGKEKTYLAFSENVEKNKKTLISLLKNLKSQGKIIVGYGAPAKGNTLLNYFGIDTKFLHYIVDDSPLKQGLYTPGTHIPVVPSETLSKNPKPDYILILAWNFAESIMEKLSEYAKGGGKFIIPVPEPFEISIGKKNTNKEIVEEDLNNIVESLGNVAHKLEGKTLLISGGSGFLGSYINQTINLLNEKVLKRKCFVISVDNYITGSEKKNFLGEIKSNKFEFIQHDIRLPINVKRNVDYIIHAAGLASPFYYQKYPLETIESAVMGAKNLLELSRLKRVKSFLFFSSSEIYGDPDSKHVPTKEDYAGHVSSVGPRACYDESKRLGETLSLVYHQQFGVPVKIVRPFNIYGPGMKPNDYRVIPTFVSKALSGEPLPVHDKGSQTRTFCYVTDAVSGFLKILLSEKNGEVYNIGNEKPEITVYDLALAIAKVSPKKVAIKKIEYPASYPAGEPQRRCPDLTKSRTMLDYNPKVDLDTGLRRSIDWFISEYKL